MDINNCVMLRRICRACMCKEKNFHSILELDDALGVRICEMLATTTPQILILPRDGLPDVICTACLNKLTISYNFQQIVIKSDKRMREILQQKEENINEEVQLHHHHTAAEEAGQKNIDVAKCLKRKYNFEDVHIVEEFEHPHEYLKVEINETETENEAGMYKKEEFSNSERFIYSDSEDNEEEESEKQNQYLQSPNGLLTPQRSRTPLHDGEEDEEIIFDPKKRRRVRRQTFYRVEQHMEVRNQSLIYKYPCRECQRGFEKQTSLAAHMLVHRRNIVHCDYCNKSFNNQNYLSRHLKIHKNERNKLICLLCVKYFSNQNELEDHTNLHASAHPFECIYCNKILIDTDSLKEHLQIHNLKKCYGKNCKNKKYTCDICDFGFTRAYTLKRHKLRRHKLHN